MGVRLRPNIMAGGNLKISTGHASSKFGVPIESIDEVLKVQKETNLFIRTLHIHTGSEIQDVEVFAKGIEVLFVVAQHFPELEVIDLGGGFKVPYMPGEEGTDILLLGKKVKEEFEWYEKTYNKGLVINRKLNYSTIEFDKSNLPTLGDNGHMVRKNIIQKVNKNSRIFLHTDAFYDLLNLGYKRYGAVNNSIIHFTGSSIIASFKKRIEYKNRFSKYNRTYFVFDKSSGKDIIRVLLFGFYALTIIQPLIESLRGYLNKREIAWFLHPIMCVGTFSSYTISVIRQLLSRFFRL